MFFLCTVEHAGKERGSAPNVYIQKEMVVPLLAVKFVGGILGGVTAYLLTGKPMGTGKLDNLFCDKENA